MTSYMIYLVDTILAPLGFSLGSPRDPDQRGSHVSIRHVEGYRINRTLIEEMKKSSLVRIRIPHELAEKYEEMARTTGQPVSTVYRTALRKYIKKGDLEEPEEVLGIDISGTRETGEAEEDDGIVIDREGAGPIRDEEALEEPEAVPEVESEEVPLVESEVESDARPEEDEGGPEEGESKEVEVLEPDGQTIEEELDTILEEEEDEEAERKVLAPVPRPRPVKIAKSRTEVKD